MPDSSKIIKNQGLVHLFTCGEDHLALDVFSDSLILLNPDGRKILENTLKKGEIILSELLANTDLSSKAEVEETFGQLFSLYKENALFSPPFEPETSFSSELKGLCIFIDGRCNLTCDYCFVKSKTPSDYLRPMSLEVAKKSLEFLLDNSNYDEVEVDFFGGEPLLNFETLRQTVLYGRELAKNRDKKINFTLTTNATLLSSDIQNFLIEQEIETVLSLDGPPEINDRFRKNFEGRGTYGQTYARIKEYLSKNPPPFYIRGTYTNKTLDFSESAKFLFQEGFRVVSLEPVVGSLNEPFTIKEEDLNKIYQEYEKLSFWILDEIKKGKDLVFFHFLLDPLRGPDLNRRVGGCGAGREYVAVSPQGYIFPCHQFVGDEKFLLGEVGKGFTNMILRQEFMELNFTKKEACKGCWARFYCSGGCHANHYYSSGSIYKPSDIECSLLKKRLEWALWLKAKLEL